jgi:predicted patatin/cPLA2 family phospholipase
MVIEGGAMRNAFTSAVLARWQERGLTVEAFDKVYATSSGAPTALFFMDGKSAEMLPMWVDTLTRWDAYNPLNILLRQPCTDIRHVMDVTIDPVDLDTVDALPAQLIVTVIRRDDGTVHYLRCTSENVRDLMVATCSLPLVSNWTVVDGHVLVDGGLYDPLPVMRAHADGARKILVMSNLPSHLLPIRWWEQHTLHRVFQQFPEMQRTIAGLSAHYQLTREFIEAPPADTDLFVVNPGRFLHSSLFTRSKTKVRADIVYGKKLADELWPELQDFLQR